MAAVGTRVAAALLGCVIATLFIALGSYSGFASGDGVSQLVTKPSSTLDDIASVVQRDVAEHPPGAPVATRIVGEYILGRVNGIEMALNTTYAQFLTTVSATTGDTIHLEPIDLRLRKGHGRAIKMLRLAYPQVKAKYQAMDNSSARRVWIDLGARFFPKGSTQWFVRYYPDSRDFNVVLFDVLDLSGTYPAVVRNYFKSFQFHQKAAWMHDRGVEVKGMKMAHVKEKGKEDNVKIHNDKRSVWTIDSVDMAKFIMSNYNKQDFVILKMDIEGGEWELLQHLIETTAIEWIDELMLECHPRDPFASVDVMHQSCLDLTNHFRRIGIACHRWV